MAARKTHGARKTALRHRKFGMRFFTDWAVYVGPIFPGKHSLGSNLVYIGIDHPVTVTIDGKSQCAMICCVPPYAAHTANCPSGFAAQLDFEPEIFSSDVIGTFVQRNAHPKNLGRLFSLIDGIGDIQSEDVSRLFGDIPNVMRKMDPRIRSVAERIRKSPFSKHLIDSCAHEVDLSTSRFSHLFQQEMGMSFRRFCGWKRIRTCAALICLEDSLLNVALTSGFFDSAHLSHAVKQFLGYSPRDLWRVFKSGNFDWYVDKELEKTMLDACRDMPAT